MEVKDSRSIILDAAERMLARYGLVKFTIDSVAAEAGMSKGGVLHYYATKHDMIIAVLSRFEDRFWARREEIYQSLSPSPSRLARATITAVLETRKRMGTAAHYRIDMLEHLDYREKIGGLKIRIFEDIRRGLRKPEMAAVATYVMDGLWMNEMFQPNPIPGAYESKAKQSLLKYIEELYDFYEPVP